jgi:hypothetical protein
MTRFNTTTIIDLKFTNQYLRSPSALRFLLVRAGNRIQIPQRALSFSPQPFAPQYHHRSVDLIQGHDLRLLNASSSCSIYPSFLANRRPLVCCNPLRNLRAYSTRVPLRASHTVRTYRSAFGSWTLVTLVVIGLLYYSAGEIRYPIQQSPEPQALPETLGEIEERIRKMTGETLPGRPGTLTPDQDEKLRQFWIATFQVLGLLETKDENGNGHPDPTANRVRSDTATSKKVKPKKRISMFRRNKGEKEEDEGAPTSPTAAHLDSDDKYGQTKEFHDALANLSPETLRAHFWSMMKQDNPDAFLLRFLRARKWDIEKALVMMVSTIRWRAMDVHLDDDIMLNGELAALEDSNSSDPAKKRLGHDFLTQMRLGKSFLHGLDKSGRPMCFVRVRLHKAGEQTEESLERYTVFVIESARLLLNPPVDTAVGSSTQRCGSD